ncbi:hypothetical protein SISNIDRAFT_531576 [Sistotremastrum niveocremeum HHB9708]|uniref:Extracellular membrane protein CFEM domain-containing protein n=1 Tax=Sistotremastrum niveocremeum HHB9708 TaxID=1314777 RepID=A0A164P3Y0_9AGAM|nr:hypothetical protein SISNIDRAFT_531576 [Sistotremastrum niveocremeum HHB9708]
MQFLFVVAALFLSCFAKPTGSTHAGLVLRQAGIPFGNLPGNVRPLPSPPFFPNLQKCGSACTALENSPTTCTTEDCTCSASYLDPYRECLQCVIDAEPISLNAENLQTFQGILNDLVSACQADGFAAPAETLTAAGVGSGSAIQTSTAGDTDTFTQTTLGSPTSTSAAGSSSPSSSPSVSPTSKSNALAVRGSYLLSSVGALVAAIGLQIV